MMVRNEVMNKDWHREYIVAAVHTKGFTLRELSERAGLKKDSLKMHCIAHVLNMNAS